MQTLNTRCPLINLWLAAACTFGFFFLGGAGTVALGQSQPPLTESARQNARQQIEALMADKAQWSSSQQKLDTQLIYSARMKAKGIVHPSAAKLRPSVTAEADGRIKVDIKGTVTKELLAAIQSGGGKVIASFPNHHSLQALVPAENLEAIAARPEVTFIEPAQKALRNAVDSEGDTTHQAIPARANFPATGAGIKVGVISDSIDNGSNAYSAAIASGNIDGTNTFIISGQAGTGEGEGLAMCEIVHDLAPKASIYFATGNSSEAQMADNILALANAGCRIICDDESYADESPFQDDTIAQAVDQVTAMGVLYFSCARNAGNRDATNSGTWQGDYTNGGFGGSENGYYHEFSSGVTENPILSSVIDFQANLFWSDPLGAATNDYDLFMLDSVGDVVYSSQNTQNGSQDPYEHIANPAHYTSGYYLVVTLYNGTGRFLHLDFGRGKLDWATPGSIRGHNACAAANSFCVAATPAKTPYNGGNNPTGPYPNPFNAGNVVEYFSSDGPRRIFYNPDGSAITPGNFSSTGGTVLLKPDFTAADGVTTSVPGFAPYFGTSAATPHAAAIAALILSYNPGLTAAQVKTVLTNSCIDIMASGWDRDSGYGILMALKALQNTPAPSAHPAFFSGEAALNNGIYYLAFPNGNLFGYYSYTYFPYLYHFDLGFDYFIDAKDGKGGAYLYDFTSGHWWYTSPVYPFPYLYDFTLNAVLYYYPNTANSGHYTTNPRSFHNFATGQDFTQ